jgi:hypothetical protein
LNLAFYPIFLAKTGQIPGSKTQNLRPKTLHQLSALFVTPYPARTYRGSFLRNGVFRKKAVLHIAQKAKYFVAVNPCAAITYNSILKI